MTVADISSLAQAERLLSSGHLEQGALIRLNALQRSQPPSSLLLPSCLDTDSADSAVRYRVVVCTCVTAGILYSLGLSVGHFTHVFVDEAGQATEPECLIPLGMLAGSNGQVLTLYGHNTHVNDNIHLRAWNCVLYPFHTACWN